MGIKIDASFSVGSSCADRYVTAGYRDALSIETLVEKISRVKGISGVAIGYPAHCKDTKEFKRLIEQSGLQVGMVEVALSYERKWKFGTFTSQDSKIRREAIDLSKEAMDAAAELKAADVQLWLGLDGYDYLFQSDYIFCWEKLIEGISEVAHHNREVKLTIEYKYTEPRHRCFISSAGKALSLIEEIDAPNVGITLDTGHSLVARENPAEVAVLLARKKRLFHLHLNDNFCDWDQDMIVGSLNILSHIELFYWLQRLNYDVWYGTDIFSPREDGIEALSQTVENIYKLYEIAGRLKDSEVIELQKKDRVVEIQKLVRETVLK